jgi:hypothetical protein
MPTSLTHKTLRRLLREYLECATNWAPGDCEALARAIRSIATSMNDELARDALRIIEGGGYEP